MASSILSSSTGGRIVTIRPEPGASHETHDRTLDILENGHGNHSVGPSRENKSSFGSGVFAGFNRTSEALEMWPPELDLDSLPTQSRKYDLGKRIFDLSLAVLIAPIVALLIASIGLLIRLTSGGPVVFFQHLRIGRHGEEFYIWKFRTMRLHGERILADHLKHDSSAREEWHHTHKLRDDPRITRLGRFLRKTSLDELPQILNVFVGNMSFVGPRPIVQAETIKYAERFPYYLAAVPGITGLWQVSGRCDVSYEARVILDETYVCKWTMSRDLWILLKTPRAVLCRLGAY